MKGISPLHVSFGKRVKKLREKNGLSQEELAYKVGIDRSYMGFVERGERNPTLEKIGKIAKALGVDISILFKL